LPFFRQYTPESAAAQAFSSSNLVFPLIPFIIRFPDRNRNGKGLEFPQWIQAKGYEIKSETFGEDAPNFISSCPLGKGPFVRSSIKSPGKEYTKERIKERIVLKREQKVQRLQKRASTFLSRLW
jgi:hypothetical protein